MKCLIYIAILFLSLSVFGQNTKSVFSVTVKNQLGELIPGAETKLTQSGTIISSGVTDKNGAIKLTVSAPGEYRIEVSAEGFDSSMTEPLTIGRGESRSLEVTLAVHTVESSVSVGGDDSVDADSFGTTRIIDKDRIASLPDRPEDLERALRALAGDSGNDLQISVDGQPGAQLPPKEAIKQIRISQNVYSAQYEGPFGGGIEIFSSSGSKKITGGGGFSFADSRFNATDAFLGRRLPSQIKSFTFNAAIPLGKRGSFFVFGNRVFNDASVSINARTLDSALRPIDLRETIDTPTRDYNIYTNASYDINKKNTVTFNYSVNHFTAKNQNVGGLSLASRSNNSVNQYHGLRISETFLVNERTVVQSRLFVQYIDSKNFGGDSLPAINVLESFFGGGSQSDRHSKNLAIEGASGLTWQRKKYELGVGFQMRGSLLSLNSTSNFGGTYTFAGRIAPLLDANGNPIIDANGNVVMTQIDSLESYRRTLFFLGSGMTPSEVRSRGGGASQFTIAGGDPNVRVGQFDTAAYLQNSYKLNETLAVSFGVRYENQTKINSDLNFAPRFGLIWAPKSDPKKSPLYAPPKISVGFGVFYRRFELNNFVELEQATGNRSQFLVSDPAVLDSFPATVSIGQLRQFALPSNKRAIDDGIQTPRQNMFSVTVSKRMPLEMNTNFTFSHSRADRQAVTRNINAPLAGTLGSQPGGIRPLGNIGDVYLTDSIGRAESTRISVGLQLPQKYVWGFINYVFTKSRSNNTGGSGSPYDPFDFSNEFGYDASDGVHRVSGYFYYEKLPLGITIDGNGEFSTGRRFNIVTGRDTNGDGYFLERPSFAIDLTKPGLIATRYGLLDPNPAPGDPVIPRNLGRGSRFFSFDLGIGKTFKFGADATAKRPPKRSLFFGVRINNFFNVVNRSAPIGNMASPNFLKAVTNGTSETAMIVNGIREGARNRSLMFNFRFSFL